jgi:hypothetical protein
MAVLLENPVTGAKLASPATLPAGKPKTPTGPRLLAELVVGAPD